MQKVTLERLFKNQNHLSHFVHSVLFCALVSTAPPILQYHDFLDTVHFIMNTQPSAIIGGVFLLN